MASSVGKWVCKRTYKARESFEDSAPLACLRLHPGPSREDSEVDEATATPMDLDLGPSQEEVNNYHLDEATVTTMDLNDDDLDDQSDPPSALSELTPSDGESEKEAMETMTMGGTDKTHVCRARLGYCITPDEALSCPEEMYEWPHGKILAKVITSSHIIDP